jgi:ribosomal protein S18 acetylase RimI-like enzyme
VYAARKGSGSSLVQHALREIEQHGVCVVGLHVDPVDTPPGIDPRTAVDKVVGFYRKLGFEVASDLPSTNGPVMLRFGGSRRGY